MKITGILALFVVIFGMFGYLGIAKAGTVDPIEIDSWTELQGIGQSGDYPFGGDYILTRDLLETDEDYESIVGDEDGFDPIGEYYSEMTFFEGTLNGNGHKIYNLRIYSTGDYIGLFDVLRGSVSNLSLVDIQISGGGSTGALAGSSWFGSVIENCHVSGTISESTSGNSSFGGLIGKMSGGTVAASSSSATVSATGSYVGGLIGAISASTPESATVVQSFSTSNVSGNDQVGGLIGYAKNVAINDSYSTGVVTGNDNVGGLVGSLISREQEATSIHRSYSTGAVSGTNNVGGLVGLNTDDQIENSFSTGEVEGDIFTGYLAGLLGGGEGAFSISESYWYGGYEYPEFFDCYLIGGEYGHEDCAAISDLSQFKGENVADLMTSWDFEEVWAPIHNGYPILRWQDNEDPVFENLPGDGMINLAEGQTITTNPYIIKVNPTDDFGLDMVKFWVDDNLLCTETEADEEGIYSCSWDTSKYHSTIRVIAYDLLGNLSEELVRETKVDPAVYASAITVSNSSSTNLPTTGINWYWYLLPIAVIPSAIWTIKFKKERS